MKNSASICETLMNPWRGQSSSLGSLCMFRESTMNKVSISDYTFNFVSSQLSFISTSFVSFMNTALITFILECYPPFHVNCLYSKPLFINFVLKLSVALTSDALISYNKVTQC